MSHLGATGRLAQTPLLLALGLWLCTLPLVLLLAVPFVGAGQAWIVAALHLVVLLAVCLSLCDRRVAGWWIGHGKKEGKGANAG